MIKEKRQSMNLTQEQMAEQLGISLRQYVRIDNEEDLPRRDVLHDLIEKLQLSNEEIGKYIRDISRRVSWFYVFLFIVKLYLFYINIKKNRESLPL